MPTTPVSRQLSSGALRQAAEAAKQQQKRGKGRGEGTLREDDEEDEEEEDDEEEDEEEEDGDTQADDTAMTAGMSTLERREFSRARMDWSSAPALAEVVAIWDFEPPPDR